MRNTTIDTTIVRIHQVLPLIQPDVVILSQYQNDLTDLANPGSPAWVPAATAAVTTATGASGSARSFPVTTSRSLRYLTYNAFAFMIEHNIKYDVLSTWSVLETHAKKAFADKLEGIYHDLYGSLVKDMKVPQHPVRRAHLPEQDGRAGEAVPGGSNSFTGSRKSTTYPILSLMPTLDANRRRNAVLSLRRSYERVRKRRRRGRDLEVALHVASRAGADPAASRR